MKTIVYISLALLITTQTYGAGLVPQAPDSQKAEIRKQLQKIIDILKRLEHETDGLKFLEAQDELEIFGPVLDKAIEDYDTYQDLLLKWDPLYIKCKERSKVVITPFDRVAYTPKKSPKASEKKE